MVFVCVVCCRTQNQEMSNPICIIQQKKNASAGRTKTAARMLCTSEICSTELQTVVDIPHQVHEKFNAFPPHHIVYIDLTVALTKQKVSSGFSQRRDEIDDTQTAWEKLPTNLCLPPSSLRIVSSTRLWAHSALTWNHRRPTLIVWNDPLPSSTRK